MERGWQGAGAPARWDPEGADSVLIVGVKEDGGVFRPSDWAERLVGVVDVFGQDQRQALRQLARQECRLGVNCVRVSARMRAEQIHAWDFMVGFAKENGLSMESEPWPGRASPVRQPEPDPEPGATLPLVARRQGPRF